MELAADTWKDDYADCTGVDIWTKYSFYTNLQVNDEGFLQSNEITIIFNAFQTKEV